MQIARSLLIVLFAFLSVAPAWSSDVGLFLRSGTSSLSPVAGKTWLLDSVDGNLKQFNASSVWETRSLPRFSLVKTTAPSVSDDSTAGFAAGSLWHNITSKQTYLCTDASVGAAVWYQISNRIAAVDVLPKLTAADLYSDWLVSGLVGSVPSSTLVMTTPSGVAYVSGLRVASAGAAYTYTANKDTYDYLQTDGTINHVAVNNLDPAPSGQTGLLLQKVVTGSVITAVTAQALSTPKRSVNATALKLYNGNYSTNFSSSLTGNRTLALPDANSNSVQPVGARVTNQFVTYIDSSGIQYTAQPVVTNLPLANSSMIVGDASGVAAAVAMSGDATLANTGAVTVTKTGGVSFAASATTNTTNASNISSGTLPAARLPNPTASTLGGVQSSTATANSFMTNINTSGVPVVAQPAFSNISGTVTTATQLPTSGVAAGSYTNTNLTVDARGLVTAASNGGTSSVFGGTGVDTAVTKGAVSETSPIQINATTFSQTVSTTWQPKSSTIVNSTSTQTYAGTTTVGNGFSGGLCTTIGTGDRRSGAGGGPGAGTAGQGGSGNNGAHGAGGANGGAGGNGAEITAVSIAPTTGLAALPFTLSPGSGGGSGASNNTVAVTVSPIGGAGGGLFVSCAAGATSVTGTLTCNGAAGTNGTGTGGNGILAGAGGAGGTIYLGSAASVSNTGTISANGGAGGNGSGTYAAGGPGGGGGWIVFHSPSNTNGTRNVTAGAKGTGDSNVTTAATAGGAGQTLSLSGTPNLPLFASLFNEGGLDRIKDVALAHKVLNFPTAEGFDVTVSQREAAVAASGGNVIKFAKIVDGSMTESTCVEIGDSVKLGDAA